MINKLCVLSCGEDKVTEGYSYKDFGLTYNYKPIKDVIEILLKAKFFRHMVLRDT